MHHFIRNAKDQKPELLIYYGKGVSLSGLFQLLHSLRTILEMENYIIRVVRKGFVQNQEWWKNTALFIVPGGRTLPHYRELGVQGNAQIIQYVERGGKYLGLCAGGYYGCSETVFAETTPLALHLKGPLHFFLGKAIGPAFEPHKFRYHSKSGAKAVHVNWLGDGEEDTFSSNVYFNGGAYFEQAEHFENVTVLSRYLELENTPPAIIECRPGTGSAILTGIHPEYSPGYLCFLRCYSSKMYVQLKKYDFERKKLFAKILQHLALKVREEFIQ